MLNLGSLNTLVEAQLNQNCWCSAFLRI